VSRVAPTRGSMMRGNLPSLGMLSGWFVQSKVIEDSDQCRYSGVVVLTELIAQPMSIRFQHDSWEPVRHGST
jgi:hypothetical protein